MCDIDLYEMNEFLKRYNQHFQEFSLRFERFKEIREQYQQTRDKKLLTDFHCYMDMLIVQIRSFCLEGDSLNRKNYTVQHFLCKFGRSDLADKINDFLDQPLYGNKDEDDSYLSIRKSIKFASDKYICHHDKLSNFEFSQIDFILAHLSNPCFSNNLDAIISEISECLLEAHKQFLCHALQTSKKD